VAGLVLGLKAQILFMAPFTAAFSRLIGGHRVTNGLTTALCLAPLIGAALGTAVAPLILHSAGETPFMLTCLPSVAGMLLLVAGQRLVQSQGAESPAGPTPKAAAAEGRGKTRAGWGARRALQWQSFAEPADLDSPGPKPIPMPAPHELNGGLDPFDDIVTLPPAAVTTPPPMSFPLGTPNVQHAATAPYGG